MSQVLFFVFALIISLSAYVTVLFGELSRHTGVKMRRRLIHRQEYLEIKELVKYSHERYKRMFFRLSYTLIILRCLQLIFVIGFIYLMTTAQDE